MDGKEYSTSFDRDRINTFISSSYDLGQGDFVRTKGVNYQFAVLGVSLDDNKDVWLQKIAQEGYTWENVCDLKGWQNKAAIIYGIEGIPNNFLIDEHGVIVARNLRGKVLSDKLEQLLP
ncbi:MAG TPA: hypothetical protein VF008_11860 [Niastella sp.]